MSTTTKKEQEHLRMKRLILDAAKDLFARDGFDNVSVRKIAAKIDYSPAALYRYFKNKEDLILSLRSEGMNKFARMQEHLSEIKDPFERLKEGGRIYLDYAHNEPEYYDLLFNRSVPSFCDPEKWIGKPRKNFTDFRETVRECIETGEMGNVSINVAVASLWASVHGLAALVANGRLQGLMPEMDVENELEAILDFITTPLIERIRHKSEENS